MSDDKINAKLTYFDKRQWVMKNKYKIKLNYDQLNSLIFAVNLAKKYYVDNITQLDMEQGMPQIVIDNRKKTLENLKDIYKKIIEDMEELEWKNMT